MKKITLTSLCLAVLIGSLGSRSAMAASITVAADTYLTVHPNLGAGDSNHGTDTGLFTIYPGGSQAYPLMKFDILPGSQFTSDATLEMYCSGFFAGGVSGVGMHLVNSAWNENTVTWNNFGWSVNSAAFSFSTGSPTTGSWVQWIIPQSVLQGWSDNPATNNGVMLVPTGGRDSTFTSREGATGFTPTLNASFTVVPEPSAFLLMGIAGVAMVGRMLWRRNTAVLQRA